MFADRDGIIEFHIRPGETKEIIQKFKVDCVVSGRTAIFPLELRVSPNPTREMPAPVLEIPRPSTSATVRPPLSGFI